MANLNLPSSPSDGAEHTHEGRKFKFNASKGRWRPAKASDLDGISSSRKRSRGVENAQLESDLDLNVDGVTVSVDALLVEQKLMRMLPYFRFLVCNQAIKPLL